MTAKKTKKQLAEADSLIHYDISLIIKDLTRTSISTLVVFGVLVALYYQL